MPSGGWTSSRGSPFWHTLRHSRPLGRHFGIPDVIPALWSAILADLMSFPRGLHTTKHTHTTHTTNTTHTTKTNRFFHGKVGKAA